MFQLDSNQPLHFIIVGTGGTGGYLIRNLARLIQSKDIDHAMTIIDGDHVELKNLIRQDFYERDLDKNKARALHARYSEDFDLSPSQFFMAPEYLSSEEELQQIIDLKPNNLPVIVGCVDNDATRILIQRYIDRVNRPIIWLDTGNSERSGQMILGTRFIEAVSVLNPDIFETVNMPTILDKYPDEFSEDEKDHPNDISCAEAAVSSPQNIAANIFNATVAFMVLNKLVAGELMQKNELKFDTATLTMEG